MFKATLYLCVAILIAIAGYGVYSWWKGPKVVVIHEPGNVEKVYVDRPVITEKEIIKYVTDKAEVQKILDENKVLQNDILVLNETISKLQSSGKGEIVYVDKPGPEKIIREAEFKDWRLHFKAVDTKAEYTLNQSFEAISTFGKDREGKFISSVKLFEIGPSDERFPLSNTQVTMVAAGLPSKHWMLDFSVQGGLNISDEIGGIVGAQWLKLGYTKAAEDSTLSLLSPMIFISSNVKEIGILPVSINLGRIPRQPLKDMWLSPYISQKRVGLGITATF